MVNKGDKLSLVIGHRGDYHACTVLTDFAVTEQGGEGRTWDLSKDVARDPLAGNPHTDRYGNANLEIRSGMPLFLTKHLPNRRSSCRRALRNAREFEQELAAKHEQTVREKLRSHSEMTWLEAVNATTDVSGNTEPPGRVQAKNADRGAG